MIRNPKIVVFGLMIVLATRVLASDLPDPPDGYSWNKVEAINASFLVPDGWHLFQERDGKTLAIFITKEVFKPPQQYETGVSINVFLNNPSAPEQVKQLFDRMAETYSAKLEMGSFGPFATLRCRYELQHAELPELVRFYNLGIGNTLTNTSYLLMFVSPASKWAQTWEIAKPVLDMLALETEI